MGINFAEITQDMGTGLCTFLVSARKVPKEAEIREALRANAPSLINPTSRSAGAAEISRSVLARSFENAPREILKRAYLARGSATLAPLKLTSLVTFLFSDKKATYNLAERSSLVR